MIFFFPGYVVTAKKLLEQSKALSLTLHGQRKEENHVELLIKEKKRNWQKKVIKKGTKH